MENEPIPTNEPQPFLAQAVEIKPSGSHHSLLFGVSIRAWIAVLVIGTVCFMSIREISIKEPLYTLAGLVVGFYFGQNPPAPKAK